MEEQEDYPDVDWRHSPDCTCPDCNPVCDVCRGQPVVTVIPTYSVRMCQECHENYLSGSLKIVVSNEPL